MKYCKSYCEEKEISTSELNETQRILYYIAENMKMDKSISEEGYKHFQMSIQALEQKTGHWIDITNKNGTVIAVRCSRCKESPKFAIKSEFCPKCGAKMQEVE